MVRDILNEEEREYIEHNAKAIMKELTHKWPHKTYIAEKARKILSECDLNIP